MPTTRRKASGPASTAAPSSQQSTLSFNSKPTRVTKANATPASKSAKSNLSEPATKKLVSSVATVEPEEEKEEGVEVSEKPVELEVVDIQTVKATKEQKKSTIKKRPNDGLEEALEKARKISDAQIKRYWKAEEDSRLAPRVHQSTIPLHEKILRHFDLSSQYGPCIGINRRKRWERANRLGLEPPFEVLAVLLKEEDGHSKPKKGEDEVGQMAYIDVLAGGGRLVD